MLDDYRIRRAVAKDRRATNVLTLRTWQPAYSRKTLLAAAIQGRLGLSSARTEPLEPHIATWVAERGIRLIGFATLHEHVDNDGLLAELHVLPIARRAGVGTALWNECIAALRDRLITGMRFWALDGSAAVAFAAARGAVQIARDRVRIGGRDVPAVCMRATL